MPQSLSIIIPVYNEAENIPLLFREIEEVCSGENLLYEVIFVNDGSTDNTKQTLHDLAQTHASVKPIHLEQNAGQAMAIRTGIENAKNELIAFLDGDMQNDPHDIPAMIKLLADCDVVLGFRKNRKDVLSKRISSAMGNLLIRILFGVEIIDAGCSLRVGKSEIFKNIPYFKNYHRYLNIIIKKSGYKTIDFETNHRSRHAGYSKYSLSKISDVITELLSLRKKFS